MKRSALISLFVGVLAAICVAQEATDTQLGTSSSSLEGTGANVLPALDRSPTCRMKIFYERGDLRISAQHCKLLDVLREVGKRTGAFVEAAPGLGEDAVFADFGPGPAREVLASLLYGSSFNYIIVGSPSNPKEITQILLTSSQRAVRTDVSTTVSVPSFQEPTEEPSAYGVGFATDAEGVANEPSASSPVSRAGALAAQQSPDGKKTPGQILDELQKQQIKQLDEKAAQPKP